ncbi:MAG: bifunctional nuclease family protein [Acidimicrobiia bacterium]|nr:MAG: bifunctional nuclease family protein [Acidimicrobiia bacterium]
MTDPVPMDLVGIRIELPTNTPILLLRERGGERYLPIWINTPEATAIALAHDGIRPERPLTHDLVAALIEELGAKVDEVVVTELRGGTFYADLRLSVGDDVHTISSRPSDAVAIAVRTDAPLFAARALLEEAGVHIQDKREEEEINKFREFLELVDPEDFEAHEHRDPPGQ